MLTTMHYILLLFLILFSKKIVCQTINFSSRKTIVVIDPGHGGRDSGALSRNGVMEKDIVLSIALKMDSINRYFYNDKLDLYLTRYKDTLISLTDRTRLAKVLKADVFITLYCNHSNNTKVKGVEVYASKYRSENTDKSIILAYLIENSISGNIGLKSRGVKFRNFQVLRENSERVSILVELGFLSQADEIAYLKTRKGQRAIASILYASILDFLRL